jgi:putative membrane protein
MKLIANLTAGFVAVEHFLILYLEMFLWQSEFGLKAFAMTPEQAATTAKLALNQGLYNGFLGAGLIWSFFATSPDQKNIRIFFLSCVLVAGIFGGLTAKTSILFTQGLPALIALIFTLINKD